MSIEKVKTRELSGDMEVADKGRAASETLTEYLVNRRKMYKKMILVAYHKLCQTEIEALENLELVGDAETDGKYVAHLAFENPKALTIGLPKEDENQIEELAKQLKKQIRVMDILIKMQQCPISKIIEGL